MKILATGTGQFLSGHVAQQLPPAGHGVRGYDQAEASDRSYGSTRVDLLDQEAWTDAARSVDAICYVGAIGDEYLARQEPHFAASVEVTDSALED